MYQRNRDASDITRRRMVKATAAIRSATDSSTMLFAQQGRQTELSNEIHCTVVSPGCLSSCHLPAVFGSTTWVPPGAVTAITTSVGSILVRWQAPSTGTAPFTYLVTPYWKGVALDPVTTWHTFYRFESLTEGDPYTFTVCAINAAGVGPVVAAPSYMIAPPEPLSVLLRGGSSSTTPMPPSLCYILHTAMSTLFAYAAQKGWGPTKGSRWMYIWSVSVAQAWNWVSSERYVTGTIDGWNWDTSIAASPLSPQDAIVWMCSVMDQIMTAFVPSTVSIYSCDPVTQARVKNTGNWNGWVAQWSAWMAARADDGWIHASTVQPTDSANWGQHIVVDDTTINPISSYPQPQQWTKLNIAGTDQSYLTYTWGAVRSTCLTGAEEEIIQSAVGPVTGSERDTEIDQVRSLTAYLTDSQKMMAEFWAGGPGTMSPPLMFLWMWKEYMRCMVASSSVSCGTLIYSLLDLAIHLFEGGRITWRLKRAWMEARPIQEIRRRYSGQMIDSWNGYIRGDQWIPYQTASFVTPPFADFPSGHSHFSKAFALVMTRWFGPNIQPFSTYYSGETLMSPMFRQDAWQTQYGVFVMPIGCSEVQPGVVPSAPVTLAFDTWNSMADSAGMSRLYGGIHAITAHRASQTTAVLLDGYLRTHWNIPTSPLPTPSLVTYVAPVTLPVWLPIPDPTPIPTSIHAVSTSSTEAVTMVTAATTTTNASTNVSPIDHGPYVIEVTYPSGEPSYAILQWIQRAIQLLQRIIIKSHGKRRQQVSLTADMIIDIDVKNMSSSTILATSIVTEVNGSVPLRQHVTLNLLSPSLLTITQFNGEIVPQVYPVLVHEMIHGLGLAVFTAPDIASCGWNACLDTTQTWYVGREGDWQSSAAIRAYRQWVGTDVRRIPVENSFGIGTAFSHWEEGLTGQFQTEARRYDEGSGAGPLAHPPLPYEIMSGVAGSVYYLTAITVGALDDHGYIVDYHAPDVVPYPPTQ